MGAAVDLPTFLPQEGVQRPFLGLPQDLEKCWLCHLPHSHEARPIFLLNQKNFKMFFCHFHFMLFYVCFPCLFLFFNYVYECMSFCGDVHMSAGVLEGQKRALEPLQLELQVFVSCLLGVLGIKTWVLCKSATIVHC